MTKYKLTIGGGCVIMDDHNCVPLVEGNMDYAAYKKWLAEGNVPEDAETEAEKIERLTIELKGERDQLLKESDVFMISDFPNGGSQAMLDYRQALRDMPENHATEAKLENPTWPDKP